jgi:hypothetical protein
MFNTQTASMAKESSHMQNTQIVNTVYKTYDLSVFKTISGNRVPNLQHIRRLASSIKEYGMKCNPIIINENYEVIDGQHRLYAAKECQTFIYYIMIEGYALSEVQTLNLNQKNWGKKDFMDAYAEIGIEPYVKLKKFVEKNDDFNLFDCIALCSNITAGSTNSYAQKYDKRGKKNYKHVFEEGTWKGKDFQLAQDWANKIRLIKPYYDGYNRTLFVGTMIGLFHNPLFDFNEFMHKLRLQPTALLHTANREQCKTLIEDIYNYKSRNKINLRF